MAGTTAFSFVTGRQSPYLPPVDLEEGPTTPSWTIDLGPARYPGAHASRGLSCCMFFVRLFPPWHLLLSNLFARNRPTCFDALVASLDHPMHAPTYLPTTAPVTPARRYSTSSPNLHHPNCPRYPAPVSPYKVLTPSSRPSHSSVSAYTPTTLLDLAVASPRLISEDQTPPTVTPSETEEMATNSHNKSLANTSSPRPELHVDSSSGAKQNNSTHYLNNTTNDQTPLLFTGHRNRNAEESPHAIFLRVCHSPWSGIGQRLLATIRGLIAIYMLVAEVIIGLWWRDTVGWIGFFKFESLSWAIQSTYAELAFVSLPLALFFCESENRGRMQS